MLLLHVSPVGWYLFILLMRVALLLRPEILEIKKLIMDLLRDVKAAESRTAGGKCVPHFWTFGKGFSHPEDEVMIPFNCRSTWSRIFSSEQHSSQDTVDAEECRKKSYPLHYSLESLHLLQPGVLLPHSLFLSPML